MSSISGRVHVIHGPNLNMLGRREPEIYGSWTLAQVNQALDKEAGRLGMTVETFQSNHEGEIVERIQWLFEEQPDGLIINPAAFTHTSVAIRDALCLLTCPVIEIHLSNIYKREPFRHKSLIADIVTGQVTGLGPQGYLAALAALARLIHDN